MCGLDGLVFVKWWQVQFLDVEQEVKLCIGYKVFGIFWQVDGVDVVCVWMFGMNFLFDDVNFVMLIGKGNGEVVVVVVWVYFEDLMFM